MPALLGPGLGALGPGPAGRQLGGNHLVHDGRVGLDAEDVIEQFGLTGVGAGRGDPQFFREESTRSKGAITPLDDTWIFDGTTWTEVTAPLSAVARTVYS